MDQASMLEQVRFRCKDSRRRIIKGVDQENHNLSLMMNYLQADLENHHLLKNLLLAKIIKTKASPISH